MPELRYRLHIRQPSLSSFQGEADHRDFVAKNDALAEAVRLLNQRENGTWLGGVERIEDLATGEIIEFIEIMAYRAQVRRR